MLNDDATVIVYGPFNIGGQFSSPSNAAFDAELRSDDPRRGIRDLEAIHLLAKEVGLTEVTNIDMPANNRCLVWRLA